MKGKTLHITIQPETVVGCLDALTHVAGIELKNRPLATLVALALEGFVATMRTNGDIPHVESAEAIRRIAIAESTRDGSRPPDFGPDFRPRREALDLPPDEPPTIERAVDAMKNQGVEVPLAVTEEPEPTAKRQESDRELLLQMPRIALSELSQQALEEDELIKRAEHEGGDYQVAVEIVYSKAPRALWGREKAKELVEKVLGELKG